MEIPETLSVPEEQKLKMIKYYEGMLLIEEEGYSKAISDLAEARALVEKEEHMKNFYEGKVDFLRTAILAIAGGASIAFVKKEPKESSTGKGQKTPARHAINSMATGDLGREVLKVLTSCNQPMSPEDVAQKMLDNKAVDSQGQYYVFKNLKNTLYVHLKRFSKTGALRKYKKIGNNRMIAYQTATWASQNNSGPYGFIEE